MTLKNLIQTVVLIRDIVRNKPILYCVQIYPSMHRTGFEISFHRRKNWTIFGFQDTVNTEYYLSTDHSFRVFQLLEKLSIFTSFHMYSQSNWIVSFYFNNYVDFHV